MKKLFHLPISVVTALLIAGMQTSPAKASPKPQELTYNPAAEEYIRNELLADGEANLDLAFENEDQRVVRGEFIVELFKDPALQEIPFFKIHDAAILGDIKANGLSIPFDIEFQNCKFAGRIEMERAKIQSFNMYNSTVTGAVRMNRIVINEDLALYESTYEGAVVLFDATIGSNFFAARSHFNGTEVDEGTSYPFELWLIKVGQSAEFRGATIKGTAMFENAEFGVDVFFENSVFEKPVNFKNFKVGNFAYFEGTIFNDKTDFESGTVERDAHFAKALFNGNANFKSIKVGNLADFQGAVFNGDAIFESGIVERDAYFSNAAFNGDAYFDYFTSGRFMDFVGTTFNKKISFTYTVVGWPYFKDAIFNGGVDFEGMQASNDFDLTGAAYNYSKEPFTVYLASVDGRVLFEGFTAPAGLSLEHNHFGDLEIIGQENQQYKIIDMTATKIDGDMIVQSVETFEFLAEGVTVADSTIFDNVSVATKLDMSNASIGFFTIGQFAWPNNPDSFNLLGMTYNDIGLVDDELDDKTWAVLLKMIEQSTYSPQAYRTLEQFLTEKGHPDWAADVEFSRKHRERDQILTRYSGPWFWSSFLWLFSGYGQRPQFAFGWSALVIIIGTIVFRREEDMVILDDSDAKPPYNPVLYSFALFLPYIDLEIASKWDPKPDRKFAGLYKHIHRLLGWILMPIALLTFGGIIG